MKSSIIIIFFITFISKFLGFGRELVLSSYFGTSFISDAYLVALTIPSVFWAVIGIGFVTTYIPVVNSLKDKSLYEVNNFTSKFCNFIFIFVTVLVLVVQVYCEHVVLAFAYGFSDEQLQLSMSLTRIMIWSLYFTGIVAVLTGFLNNKGGFKLAAGISFPLNFVVIVSIYFAYTYEVQYLAYGFLIATLSQALLIVPFAIKSGFRYSFGVPFSDEKVRYAFKLALPVILGVSVNQLNVICDKLIGSTLGSGSISSLNYGYMVTTVIHTVIVMSLVTVAYPSFAKIAQKNNVEQMKIIVYKVCSLIMSVLIPATVLFLAFADDIVKLLYQRGEFGQQSVMMTSSTFFYYSFGLVAVGLREILVRVFYSFGNSKTPLYNSIFCVVVNVALNFLLSPIFGIGGLALASSISAILACGLLWVNQRRLFADFFNVGKLFMFSIRIFVFSCICYFTVSIIYQNLLHITQYSNLAFVTSLFIGLFIYLLLVFFTKTLKKSDLDIKNFGMNI